VLYHTIPDLHRCQHCVCAHLHTTPCSHSIRHFSQYMYGWWCYCVCVFISNTHILLLFRYLPKDMKNKKVKTVLMIRNPKDTTVSLYNHTVAANACRYSGTFEHFVRPYVLGKSKFYLSCLRLCGYKIIHVLVIVNTLNYRRCTCIHALPTNKFGSIILHEFTIVLND